MPFTKGNQFGRGRPKISLQKPELLLPAVFGKAGVNWQNDFMKLYRILRTEERKLSDTELRLLRFFADYMPYLCTKITLKEIENTKGTPADSVAQAKATSKLLQALEAESNAPSTSKPETSGS